MQRTADVCDRAATRCIARLLFARRAVEVKGPAPDHGVAVGPQDRGIGLLLSAGALRLRHDSPPRRVHSWQYGPSSVRCQELLTAVPRSGALEKGRSISNSKMRTTAACCSWCAAATSGDYTGCRCYLRSGPAQNSSAGAWGCDHLRGRAGVAW